MMMAAAAMMAGIGPIYLVPWNRGLKRGAKKKATLSQKLVYVMATLCDILL